MESSAAALVSDRSATNHTLDPFESSDSSGIMNGSSGEGSPLVHYPRPATVFAAVASIIFIIVGIAGKCLILLLLSLLLYISEA